MTYKDLVEVGLRAEGYRLATQMFLYKVWFERPMTKRQMKAGFQEWESRPIGKN